jgi:hypothetical protein
MIMADPPVGSSEALIEDINTDKRVALQSLSREAYVKFGVDPNIGNDAVEEMALL